MFYILLKHVGKKDYWQESFLTVRDALNRIQSLPKGIRVCTRDRSRIFR